MNYSFYVLHVKEGLEDREKSIVLLNYPDMDIFKKSNGFEKDNDSFIIIYPGTLLYHQGLDIAINAINTSNIAATLIHSLNPSPVPLLIESRTFFPILSFETSTSFFISSV